MAQFKPFVLNVQAPDQRPAARYPRQFSTGDEDSTPFDGIIHVKESKTCRYISGLIMFLFIFVALVVVCSQSEGQFSFWTNAKSMHYTSSGTLAGKSWWAVVPATPYFNADPDASHLIYAADSTTTNQGEDFQFQLASGGFLSNISPYACVTAVLLIYMLRTIDFVVFTGETHKSERFFEAGFTKNKIFLGVSVLILALYVVLNMWYVRSVKWGKVTDDVEFKWQQSWNSFTTGIILIFLYMVQIYFKERSKPTEDDEAPFSKAYDKLQSCNDYATEYSITSYLLISMLLGMSRSVVLETEAQLLLMSALGLSLLTYLLVDVRAYFQYVEECFQEELTDPYFSRAQKSNYKELHQSLPERELLFAKDTTVHTNHHTMMEGTFLVTQIICTAVAFVFFGIACHVLFVLADSLPAVFYMVVILLAVYLGLQAFEVLLRILPSTFGEPQAMMAAETYYWCSIAVMFIVTGTVLGSAAYMNANDGDRIRLRQLESVQYLAMQEADSNSLCQYGVQKNPMLQLMGGFSTDMKFGDRKVLEQKNPVNFKVFHWTRWWEIPATSPQFQGPLLYLCSLGMDQYFGTCHKQYKAQAQAFRPDFQPFVDEIATKLTT